MLAYDLAVHRIALVIDDGLDRPDGVQQYVLTLGRALSDRGHEVHYLTSDTQRTDVPNLHVLSRNVGVKFNGNRLSTPLPLRRATARDLLAELEVDVVHVQMPFSPLLAGRVVDAADPGAAVVGTFLIYPNSALASLGARALGRSQRRRLRRFDEVVSLSEAAQEFARSSHGLRTEVIGAPVDLTRFTPTPTAPSHDDGVVSIVFLGRLVERKGARALVRAAIELSRRAVRTPWRLVVAGRGPLSAELEESIARAGLADRVTFPGFVSEDDKPALLASADIVALPSTGGESFGVSVVEALACARGVVIAGDNPGYRTTMAGFEDQLVAGEDTAAFASLLARWVDDPAGRAAIAPRQQHAARRFDTPAITAEIEALYSRALASRT